MRIKNPLDNIKYPLFNRSHSNAKKKRASSEQNLEHDFPSQSEATVNGSVPEIRNRNCLVPMYNCYYKFSDFQISYIFVSYTRFSV